MQISTSPLRVGSGPQTAASSVAPAREVDKEAGYGTATRVDFSRITPRQLQAYLDDMVMNDRIDLLDAGTLGGALAADEWTNVPDVPIDLHSRIQGTKAFHRDRGDPLLATWYAGLLDRMEVMQAKSVSVSIIA